MGAEELVGDYLSLALRMDRLVPGSVEAYTGGEDLRRRLGGEPAPQAADLARDARRLLRALPTAGFDPARTAFLAAQVRAVECAARRLQEKVSFSEEVEAFFDTAIAPGDQGAYRAAHRELDALLPGRGPLGERLTEHRRRDEIPPDRLADAVAAMSAALRERVLARWTLPAGEAVEYRIVAEAPWSGFNQCLGGHRSRVSINAGVGLRAAQLPHLVAHESYPGHHTERCRKDVGLVAREGRREHTVSMVNTPQCLLAEGLADLGLHVAVGPGWGPWVEQVLAEVGLRTDGELAERVERASAGLLRVRQDAALLLHDRGASEEEVLAYLRRWLLVTDGRARQMLRFLAHPVWRSYTTTYVEGAELVHRWVDVPGPAAPVERYGRLLDEALTPAAMRAELAV